MTIATVLSNLLTDNTLTVTARKGAASVDFDVTTLSEEIMAQAIIHGLTQKIADAAASAPTAAFDADYDDDAFETSEDRETARKAYIKAPENAATIADEATARMAKTVDQLAEGEWNQRGTAGAVDPLDAYRILAVRGWMAENAKGAAKELVAAHGAIDSKDQSARRALLLSVATQNAEYFDEQAATLLDLEKRKRNLAKGKAAVVVKLF